MAANDILCLGGRVDRLDWSRGNALSYAVKASRFNIAQRLIALGAHINSQDTDGWAPLHFAADTGNMNMVIPGPVLSLYQFQYDDVISD